MSFETELRPGEARCPAPSAQELVARDGQPTPFPLNLVSYSFLGDDDIDFSRYTAQDFFRAETDKIWNRTWQWACREEHIPAVGDYVTYDVTRYSLIVVRTAPDRIQAFHNACMHRGTKLRPSFSEGSAEEFRCSYHGWAWNLDGSLKDVTCRWDFPHVGSERFHLPEARVETWGGFVFINMDPAAPPLEDYLGVVPEHFGNWRLEERYVALHIEKELPCNWKLAQEAFLEAYHVLETHPHLLVSSGDVNAQYDLFGEHVSRMYTALGVPSPHLKEAVSEQQIVDGMLMGDRSLMKDDGRLTVKPGQTARTVLASYMREELEKGFGTNLSSYSDTEVIDNIQYQIFPNMVIQPGLSLPMVYRFRPMGMDPSRSLFELLFLRPVPDSGLRPEPAIPVRLGVEDSYTTVPGVDYDLGFIYDQDTNNLRMQQEGCAVSHKAGQTLANYQECRTRNFHQTLDKYMSL